MAHKIVSAEAAIAIVHDDDVLATTGYGGNGVGNGLGGRPPLGGPPIRYSVTHPPLPSKLDRVALLEIVLEIVCHSFDRLKKGLGVTQIGGLKSNFRQED